MPPPVKQTTASAASHADLASTIASTMRRMNVPALPRNYALYYTAMTEPDSDVAKALARLGSTPDQKLLDEVAEIHLGRTEAATVSEAHGEIMGKLSEIIALLKIEQIALEKYGRLLGETSIGLSGRNVLSQDFLRRIVSLISTATDTTIDHGRKIASSMGDKSNELAEVHQKLEKYKKLAETDALTQLNNRRSFDREMAAIYEDRRKVMFSSLILADIDLFKPVNDTHGHPVGDRILQIVASIFGSRSCSRVFVARAGGEEFALILRDYTEESATALAEEIREAVAKTPFVNVATGKDYGPITLSFGLCMASEADGPDDLYMKADRALYASKSKGRNKVTRFSELATGSFVKNWLLYSSE